MMKYVILTFSLLFVVIFSCCGVVSEPPPIDEPTRLDEYLSITVNYVISYDEATDYEEVGISVYEYDLHTNKLSEIFSFPQNSLYALGVYDKKANSVYYTKEKDNDTYERRRTGDQIYKYDLETGSDILLTEDLLAVNHIVPVEDAVFFVAALKNNYDSLTLGKIDLTDGAITYWNESDTLSVERISVDRDNERVYVSVYDNDERDYAVHLFNSGESPHPVAYNNPVWSFDYDLGDKQVIFAKDKMGINVIHARDNKLLYCMRDQTVLIQDAEYASEMIDINSMEVLFQLDEPFTWRGGGLSQDLSGVYSGLRADDEGFIIEYYDFETRERETLYTTDFGYFANMQFMY